MAWSFVGVSAAVTVTATSHALTEPAGCQAGDLLVAVISSRIASTTSITLPAGWTLVAESKTNNVVAAATTSEASGMMAYIVRGDAAPALTFTHPTAPSVAMGRIVAYRGGDIWEPFDVGVGNKTGTGTTSISLAGLTTAGANELIVRGVCSGRASAFSAFDAATDPTTSSGTNSVQTAAPIVGTWQERQDSSTTTGADTALAIADAIRGTAGATGNLTCTASVSGGHAQVSGAFKIEPIETPGSSSIAQTGSTLDFSISSAANSGTVSSTITVPSDAQIVVVGLKGWCSTAPYFTNMTFTKGGADTAMTRVGVSELANGHTAAIFYLVLPDTGTNKSLKFDWAGAAAPGEAPLASVTFWKGIDTASPVRSSGGSLAAVASSSFKTRTSLMTAQNGDLAVCFAGGDNPGADGTIDTWYNLNLLTQCTKSADRHDGAWATFAPSQNLYVGADTATGMTYGVCAAIVLKPAPLIQQVGSTLEFAPNTGGNTGTVSTTITVPADAELVLVCVTGYATTANYFPGGSMTFTKGGVDTAMVSATGAGGANAATYTASMFYQVLPDTGANKTLKWDWLGATAPGHNDHKMAVTFWKGIDTASPVRDADGAQSASNIAGLSTPSLTAQSGDKILCWAGWFVGATNEGSVNVWSNLTTITNCTKAPNGDGALAGGDPSGNTTVGVTSGTFLSDGGICAIVLKPAPKPTQVGFAYNGTTSGTTVTTTIPATAAGDCIIVAGLTQGVYQPGITITAGGQSVVWGKLGGLTSPRYSAASGGLWNYVGIIVNPTPGTTSVVLAGGTSGQHELACWVVSGLTNPVQDVGIWVPGQIGGDPANINLSGLSGTLAVADEFAVSFNQADSNTASINTSQSGSSGFTADATTTTNFGSGYSHKVCAATTPIQAAWNLDSSGGNCLLATYRSTPPAAPTPPPISLVGFAGRQLFDTVLNTDYPPFPATQSGDCIIFAGIVAGSIAGLDIRTPTNELGVFGTLGGVTSPVLSGSTYNFVGIIANPAVGTTSIRITTTENNSKALGAWVVRGLTNPAQDKGVWTAAEDEAVATSGLTGTLAAADEFAVSVARPPNLVNSVNVAQTGSGGFLCDTLVGYFDGGVSHQITEATTSIQSAWNTSTGGADVSLATYRSGDAGVSGTLATTEAADVAAINATVRWVATLAAPETVDVLASVGTVRWQATLAETEDPDVAAINATVRWAATLTTTEAADVAAFLGTTRWNVTLATIETADTAALTATVRWVAILDTTEAADAAAFLGSVGWIATLATVEPADTGAFTGAISWQATLATTEAPDTALFDGVVLVPPVGDLATTEAPDTAAFLGAISWQVTLAAPEAADAASFLGTARWLATLATSEAADVGAFVGTTRWTATLATTEGPDVAAFTAGLQVAGTLGTSEAPDVAALTGAVRWSAALATTEGPDVGAFLGTTRWSVTLAASEAPDVAAITATVSRVATLATTEAPDVVALTVAVRWAGVLAVTEGPDVASFLGGIYATGTLAVTEGPDTAAFVGGIYATGVLAASEAPDVYAGLGTAFGAGIGGNLAATEAADGGAFTGQVTGVAGFLAATEATDVGAFLGTTRWVATLATVEAKDVLAFLGGASWIATLSTTEAKDTAAILGVTRWPATLATSEAPDQAAFTGATGALPSGVVLDAREAPDVGAFTGSTVSVGALITTEAPDLAAFVAGIYTEGILAATEAPDRALLTAQPPDIADAPGRILTSKQARVRELASDERVRTLQGPAPCRDLGRDSKRVRSLKYPIPRTHELVKRIDELTGV